MCLRFVYLLITRVAAWLRLSRREETWKTAEILILRHQFAVLQAAAAPPEDELGGPGPARGTARRDTQACRQGLRLLVTPDTIVRWHRDIVRRRWATRSMRGRTGRRPPAGTSRPWSSGSHARTPNGATAGSTGNWPAWECESRRRPCGRSSRPDGIDPAPRRTGPTWSQFLRSQAEAILACDFFSVDLLTAPRPPSWP